MSEATVVHVVCAVFVDPKGRCFSVKRSPESRLGGLWEFPGGKIEAGESPVDALLRELKEELDLDASQLAPFCSLTPVRHKYDFGTVELLPFLLRCRERPIFILTEHTDSCWFRPKEAKNLAWAPADIPILAQLDW
jgi:8-oxo-dGTP diphosphatase